MVGWHGIVRAGIGVLLHYGATAQKIAYASRNRARARERERCSKYSRYGTCPRACLLGKSYRACHWSCLYAIRPHNRDMQGVSDVGAGGSWWELV
ncbi:hypothetical protein GGR51DRAFT_543731, partial [Nemania sp. FL0031]